MIISTCQYVRKSLRVLPIRPRPSGDGCYSSTPPKQLNNLVRTELELTKRVVQGRFVQCVARVRLVKADQVWAARGVKELPHRPPMRLQRTIAEVTKKADETPPRKLHGKSGHSYNSVETYMNLRARSVLYLADGTSVNTISTANTKLAISENTACNGCRWK